MKNKQKYDKETLSQYDWSRLYRLQCRLAKKKMTPGAIINICVAIAGLFIKKPVAQNPNFDNRNSIEYMVDCLDCKV